jgi:hypothetical protein
MTNRVRCGLLVALLMSVVIFLPASLLRADEADLSGIKNYLLEKTEALQKSAEAVQTASSSYYDLAQAAKFDYAALQQNNRAEAAEALAAAKAAWIVASPLYEQMEGIVAGVDVLAEYDVILDAGASIADDPENAVPFDLTLPDGTVLEKPGNLFGLLETTLWGTRAEFVAVPSIDLNADGKIEFGEVLPDAKMLKGSADLFSKYAGDLAAAAKAWEPTVSDAFTALVVMVPTMSEYFESWKLSRFVAGTKSQQAEFSVISRLSDITDILSGLEVVYQGVSRLIQTVNPEQDKQISQGLTDLKAYVADLLQQEKDGKTFTAEEAELFGSEAQSRADLIVGQITQVAAELNIELTR